MSGEKIAEPSEPVDTAEMADKLPALDLDVRSQGRSKDRRRSSSERRRATRIPFIAAVKQRVAGRVRLGLALNLGLNGIALRCAPGEHLLPRTTIDLSFELPDGGELVKVKGIVMFSRELGPYQTSGIRFESVAPEARTRIQALIGDESRMLVAV